MHFHWNNNLVTGLFLLIKRKPAFLKFKKWNIQLQQTNDKLEISVNLTTSHSTNFLFQYRAQCDLTERFFQDTFGNYLGRKH